MKHHLFLVEDHPVIRESVRLVLQDTEDLDVMGEAETAEKALEIVDGCSDPRLLPSLVLVDISLPGMNGIELIERIGGRVPTLVLTGHDRDQYRQRALRAGARGFLVKTDMYEQLIPAVRYVLQGKIWNGSENGSPGGDEL